MHGNRFRWTFFRSTLAGLGVYIFCLLLSVYVHIELNLWKIFLLAIPAFPAFIASYTAPRKKFITGMSMSAYGAVFSLLLFDGVGFGINRGALNVFLVSLFYCAFLSVVGAGMGILLSSKKSDIS